MSRELQPPVLSVSLVRIKLPTVIKDEIVEIGIDDILHSSESEEEIISDEKDIDIVYHPVCDEFIKSEIPESEHCKYGERQGLVKQADNITQRHKTGDTSDENVSKGTSQAVVEVQESEEEIILDEKDIDVVYHPVCDEFIKSEILESKHCESVERQVLVRPSDNITRRNKTGDPSDENVSKGTSQAVVEVQGSNEYSNVLGNLESDKQLIIYLSRGLNGFSTKNKKAKQLEKTNLAKCYKTAETTSWDKVNKKTKVIKAPVIPVEPHEYTSLAKYKHVCNHCQHAFNKLGNLKTHIVKIHRELTTMYQCPYCSFQSKWKPSIACHIIIKHKDIKDIQWFQCNLCEMKFKLKGGLTQHMKVVHLRHEQMKDGFDLREKRFSCNKCNFKTYTSRHLKSHNVIHLKPEEIEYFYCYHCSYKAKWKWGLKTHIFGRHFKNVKQGKRFGCNKCNFKTYLSANLKRHNLVHLKPEEIEYFYCYHCSYKAKSKGALKTHIFVCHFKNVKQGKRFGCNKCNFKTYISAHLKRHNLVHLKPEEIEYFYCYHCSYKSKRKEALTTHIFRRHFKNVKQAKRFGCNKCDYETYTSTHLKSHNLVHLKPEQIEYFYCYHCSYKSNNKMNLKRHILRHFKKEQVEFDCYICNFMTPKRELITKHIKKHSKVQNESEINEGC